MKRVLSLLLVLMLVPLTATACVSSRLVEANQRAVTALAKEAIAADPNAMAAAQEAVDTAAALVDASGWFSQMLHLGLPSDLVASNSSNVETLAGVFTAPTAEQKRAIEEARKKAGKVSGEVAKGEALRVEAEKNPWLTAILTGWVLVTSGITSIWGSTRGRRHLANWWHRPGDTIPEPPPPLPGDPTTPAAKPTTAAAPPATA